MTTPFSLRIFVADGDPDGLRIVERGNWNAKALVFPRAVFPKAKQRPECNLPGVYLLLGPATEGDGDALYIGEGDPVKPRLESHFANKDFWTRAVFFTAGDFLNKTCIQYLESRLIAIARAANRVTLENGNAPAEPSINEGEKADMDAFLNHMLGLLPLLGIHAFVRPEVPTGASLPAGPGPAAEPTTTRILLTCSGKGVSASGFDGTEGFIVRAGSTAVAEVAPVVHKQCPWVERERQALLSRGVLKPDGATLRFTQDYPFNSPSGAAAAIFGRPANGRVEWKDASGRTLKELQTEQTASSR